MVTNDIKAGPARRLQLCDRTGATPAHPIATRTTTRIVIRRWKGRGRPLSPANRRRRLQPPPCRSEWWAGARSWHRCRMRAPSAPGPRPQSPGLRFGRFGSGDLGSGQGTGDLRAVRRRRLQAEHQEFARAAARSYWSFWNYYWSFWNYYWSSADSITTSAQALAALLHALQED